MTQHVNFGLDTSCTDSLRTGRLVSGARLVGEACYRRLITSRGTLPGGEDEQNYGLDLADLLGSVSTKADEAALPGRIQTELLKDERLNAVDVNVVSTKSGPSVSWEITIEGHTDAGPFVLVLGVAGVTVDLLKLQAE